MSDFRRRTDQPTAEAYGWELRGNKAIKNGKSTLEGWKDYMRKKDERQGALYISLCPFHGPRQGRGVCVFQVETHRRAEARAGDFCAPIKI